MLDDILLPRLILLSLHSAAIICGFVLGSKAIKKRGFAVAIVVLSAASALYAQFMQALSK